MIILDLFTIVKVLVNFAWLFMIFMIVHDLYDYLWVFMIFINMLIFHYSLAVQKNCTNFVNSSVLMSIGGIKWREVWHFKNFAFHLKTFFYALCPRIQRKRKGQKLGPNLAIKVDYPCTFFILILVFLDKKNQRTFEFILMKFTLRWN